MKIRIDVESKDKSQCLFLINSMRRMIQSSPEKKKGYRIQKIENQHMAIDDHYWIATATVEETR